MSFIRTIKSHLRLYLESVQDCKRYLDAAETGNTSVRHHLKHLESGIIRRYHMIEKGLSMPNFRARFGKNTIRELVSLLRQWDQFPGDEQKNSTQIASAREVLRAYRDRHQELGIDVEDILAGCRVILDKHDEGVRGGVMPWASSSPEDYQAFLRIFSTRSSIRSFDINRVPCLETIKDAVKVATKTPSVCNRQTWRVHVYESTYAQQMLECQSGNRGFGHTVPTVLVVTSDMRFFHGPIERYQPWIDGGMFSMSILLALHGSGLGAIPLNWAVLNHKDRQLRKIGRIPDYERVIMLIGCGYPAKDTVVPVSHRSSVECFIQQHDL